ncbi:F-box/FBD/LRR-repeat protein At1g13570-like [Lolium rigidum]|uniref:F-box/FBD/LRR-repeat protein At1g13570-like n=1 Tax=Lolium rigidum TaxID=89674 RepID=UPI001F5C6EEF|nr:F-box/FBD/LRR-repeat protein At1g13570-like [Lolium rigidum]
MGSPAPPVPMDRVTEALLRVRGEDPQDQEALVGRILGYIHLVLPDPPVSRRATLRAFLPNDDVDRVSALPYALLRNIVSRLPDKDAARTAVLATRWRELWRRAPLVLVDSHFLAPAAASAGEVARTEARRVTANVSRVLAAHPGPFRCAHLTCSYMAEFPSLLARWLQTLAVKGVQDLVLVNRPFPLALDLPAALFGMPALTRLYLGFFKFPDTAGLQSTVSFPNLRELGLCTVVIFGPDMDFILARSPALEILCIQANLFTERLRIVSRSLRCVQVVVATDLDILLAYAPHLERLIVWSVMAKERSNMRIKIAPAPALSILGYLEPEFHTLEIGNTVIKAETRASPTTMVPTVKILGLRVRFGIGDDVKLLPAFLRCFPSVERLHIESKKTAEPTGKLNLEFWKDAGAIECVQSHIKLMMFHNFHGYQSELSFLQFILENAPMLTKLVIVYPKRTFTSVTEANSKLEPLFSAKWASTCCSLLLSEGAYAEGEEPLELQSFKRGSNFSVRDPFAFIVRA